MTQSDTMILNAALKKAQRHEKETGRPHYVVHTEGNVANATVTDRMPMLGTWYTSDGIRHN